MRPTCYTCRKPQVSCYCKELHPVSSRPRIVILMHPLEARHPVGTGRLAHRCLSNSRLWVGTEFDEQSELACLIRDPSLNPLLLFPGAESISLDGLDDDRRSEILDSTRESVVIVLDATWSIANKMLRQSPVLQAIPRVSFSPGRRSGFLVRRQPRPECLSSLEAIHRVLCLMDGPERYEGMLRVFESMVSRQLAFTRNLP
jgi:DTW domain-containing protein YfiP